MNDAVQLAELLAEIERAEIAARYHDGAGGDASERECHAAAAQSADESAEAARRAARTIIERAFPGVAWPRIAQAGL